MNFQYKDIFNVEKICANNENNYFNMTTILIKNQNKAKHLGTTEIISLAQQASRAYIFIPALHKQSLYQTFPHTSHCRNKNIVNCAKKNCAIAMATSDPGQEDSYTIIRDKFLVIAFDCIIIKDAKLV